MPHTNPIKEAQRRFAANPPKAWVKAADKIADRGYERADQKRKAQQSKDGK